LSQQLEYFKEYKTRLTKVAGSKQAAAILKDAIYILSAGSGDFLQNYYINPSVRKTHTPDEYSSFLVGSFSKFVKVHHCCY